MKKESLKKEPFSTKALIKEFCVSLWISFCSLLAYGAPVFADGSGSMSIPSVNTNGNNVTVQTNSTSTDPATIIHNSGVQIFAWLAGLTLLAAIILIVWTTLQGMIKTHEGAGSALKDSMGKIGAYVVLLAIAFSVSFIFAIALAVKGSVAK